MQQGRQGAHDSTELVERIRAGDRSAWPELVERYQPRLRRLTRQYRLSGHDAEDAVQVTWLRCVEHLDQLAHADRLGAWLAAICRRECLRLATCRQREVALGEQTVTWLVDNRYAEGDPCGELARRDEHARLNRAVTALPERQRSVLTELARREGQSYLDLSRRLGLPVGSIGPTWQRGLARLRRDPELAVSR